MTSQPLVPNRIEPHDVQRIRIGWNTGDTYVVPYFELRCQCPCAACVDEKTGKRILRREEIDEAVRVTSAQVIGRYAVNLTWSDGHQTGMYHFDRLHDLCVQYGTRI